MESPADQQGVMLQLLQEKHALEEEVRRREEERARRLADYEARRQEVQRNQEQKKEQTNAMADALARDWQGLKAAEEALARQKLDYAANVQQIELHSQERNRLQSELMFSSESAQLELQRRQAELQRDEVRSRESAEGLKAARFSELEAAKVKYEAEIQTIAAREGREREVAAGVRRSVENWRNLLERKKKEQIVREAELGKLEGQLKAVRQHVASQAAAVSQLKSQSEAMRKQLVYSPLARCRLELTVRLESGDKLRSSNNAKRQQIDQLQTEAGLAVTRIDACNKDITAAYQSADTYREAIDSCGHEYKQLDHSAGAAKREEEKLTDLVRQHEAAIAQFRDAHRQHLEFLSEQRSGLVTRVERSQQRSASPQPLNLDSQYFQRNKASFCSVTQKSAAVPRSEALREQIAAQKPVLDSAKSAISQLGKKLDERSSAHRRLATAVASKGSSAELYKYCALLLGLGLGAVLEFWVSA